MDESKLEPLRRFAQMAKAYLIVAHVGAAALLSSHVEVRHFCVYYSILSEPSQRRLWVGSLSLGPFCVELASSLCVRIGSLRVVRLPQTVQRHVHKAI